MKNCTIQVWVVALLLAKAQVFAAQPISLLAAQRVDLFDGKTLEGWQRQGGTAEFRVEDGMIIGRTVKDAGNTFLCTSKHYADFELIFEVKFLGKPINSGCCIRALVRKEDGEKRYMKKGNVYGPQVEIEASGPNGSESGNIYGQGLGTDFLKPKVRRVKAIRDKEWNHIRILAVGSRIRTWINDEAIADITHREIYKAHSNGMIGLQVHGVKNFTELQEIAWRNIRITEFKRGTALAIRTQKDHEAETSLNDELHETRVEASREPVVASQRILRSSALSLLSTCGLRESDSSSVMPTGERWLQGIQQP